MNVVLVLWLGIRIVVNAVGRDLVVAVHDGRHVDSFYRSARDNAGCVNRLTTLGCE